MGFLYYLGWRRNGRLSLDGVVLFRRPLTRRQWLLWAPALLIWAAAAATLAFPADEWLRVNGFAWRPESLDAAAFAASLDRSPPPVLWAVAAASLALNVLAPLVEELYFRGYLLPRIARWGWAAPLASVLLFSIYHFWAPWQQLSRVLALLPMVLAALRCAACAWRWWCTPG